MADTGMELGVDCYELWHAGQTLLPEISGQFFLAQYDVTPGNVSYAFQRSGDIGLGATGPYDSWQSVADQLNSYLGQTAQNLADVGVALRMAAETYAKTDQAAEAEFQRRQKELG